MKERFVTLGLTLLLLAFAGCVTMKPPAPGGFTWRRLEDVKIDVKVPDGWIVDRFEYEGTISYKITSDKTYRTGLTINITKNVSQITERETGQAIPAAVYAAGFLNNYKDNSERLFDEWDGINETVANFNCDVLKDIDGILSRIRISAIGNMQTDTMYVWMFGADENQWAENWRLGEVMMNPILIDKTY